MAQVSGLLVGSSLASREGVKQSGRPGDYQGGPGMVR